MAWPPSVVERTTGEGWSPASSESGYRRLARSSYFQNSSNAWHVAGDDLELRVAVPFSDGVGKGDVVLDHVGQVPAAGVVAMRVVVCSASATATACSSRLELVSPRWSEAEPSSVGLNVSGTNGPTGVEVACPGRGSCR